MKKLLFTAIAAAGAAFGLQAAVTLPSGTSFEGVDASAAPVALNGASVTYLGAGGSFSFPTNDYKADITAYTGTGPSHVDAFGKGDQYNFLDVKTTFGNPLNYGLEAAQDIGDGLYFDSLVKFTACDEAPTTDYQDAKIVVWYQETDAEGSTPGVTNFFIKAGQYANGQWTSATYECTYPDEIDMTAWHRLTIKAIENVTTETTQAKYVTGFVVFVDGQAIALPTGSTADTGLGAFTLNASAAEFASRKQLFPSLVQGTQAALKISSVGFDGQGAIDDIVLTDDAPEFAKDKEFFTITMGEHVTGFTYKVDSEDPVEKKADVQLPYTSGMTVTISDVTCDDGYMYKELTGDTGVDVDGNVFTPGAKDLTGTINAQNAAASFNGQSYATVAEAVAEADKITDPGTYTLKLWGASNSGLSFMGTGAEGVEIVIDLAGQTITDATAAIMSMSALNTITITNSTPAEGVVNGPVAAMGALNLQAGKINGLLSMVAGTITGGKIRIAENEAMKAVLDTFVKPDGYVLAEDPNDNGYYVVSEKPYEGPEKDKDGAYLIKTEQDLVWVAEHFATYQNAKLIQQNDIAMTAAFPGIGDAAKPLVGDGATNKKFNDVAFLGTYDGNNKKITNFKLTKLAPGWGDIPKTGEKISEYSASMDHEYGGFINSAGNGAIVKDLTIELGDNGGWGTETASAFGGAAFVGTARGATLQNLKTAGTNGFSGANKAMAGIVGFAAADTLVKDCENNIAINTTNEKGGGIAAITQASSAEHPATFDGCKNTGDITGASKASGINAYVDTATVIRNCENTGAAAYAIAYQNNANLTVEGTNKGQASLPATNTAVDGLNFATIDDNVATYVANATVAQGGIYKVMVATAPAITLADGKTLTLDKAATVTAATPADYYIATSGTYTYTSTAKTTPTITVTLNPDTVEYTAGMSFPTPQVTGADTYDTSWAPTAITEPAAGATNEYVVTISVAATETTKAAQGQATLKVYKSAGPVYPQDLPDDPTVKAKYADWAKGKTIDDPNAPEVMEAFLLNCELSEVETEKAKFKIVSITQDANGDWIVKVTGEKGDGAEYGNGFVEIVPYEGIDVGDNGELFQAKLVPQLSTKGE